MSRPFSWFVRRGSLALRPLGGRAWFESSLPLPLPCPTSDRILIDKPPTTFGTPVKPVDIRVKDLHGVSLTVRTTAQLVVLIGAFCFSKLDTGRVPKVSRKYSPVRLDLRDRFFPRKEVSVCRLSTQTQVPVGCHCTPRGRQTPRSTNHESCKPSQIFATHVSMIIIVMPPCSVRKRSACPRSNPKKKASSGMSAVRLASGAIENLSRESKMEGPNRCREQSLPSTTTC